MDFASAKYDVGDAFAANELYRVVRYGVRAARLVRVHWWQRAVHRRIWSHPERDRHERDAQRARQLRPRERDVPGGEERRRGGAGNGRLCRGDRAQGWGDRHRRALMSPSLRSRVTRVQGGSRCASADMSRLEPDAERALSR